MIQLRTEGRSVFLPLKVVPGASRTKLLGEWDGRVRLAVAAAPEKGKANAELVAFLAKRLSLPKSQVTVIAGHGSPLKTIRIDGAEADAVRAALQPDRS